MNPEANSEKNRLEREGWQPLFPLGHMVFTISAVEALQQASRQPRILMDELHYRHVTGDWGNLPEEDKKRNDTAVEQGREIQSAYDLEIGVTIWVLTSANRVQATVMTMEFVSPHG